MRWRRVAVALALAGCLAAGLAGSGLEGFVHSFTSTLDAGAVGFFATTTVAVWLSLVTTRAVRRRVSVRVR